MSERTGRGKKYEIERRAMGKELRRNRKVAGLTQARFAEAVGIKRTAVVAWENGKRRLYIDDILAICAALSWDPESLMRQMIAAVDEVRRSPSGQSEGYNGITW